MDKSWEYNHSGVFTKDFKGTIKYWKDLGLATTMEGVTPKWGPNDTRYLEEFDETPVFDIPEDEPFLQLLYIGDFEMELLHAEQDIPRGEMLAYREGVNHICISVGDIDGETTKLVNKGLRIVQDAYHNDVRGEDYLDTREPGHIFLSFRTPMAADMKKRKAQIGIVPWKFLGHTSIVKDLDKLVRYYEYLEIAEFETEQQYSTKTMSDVEIYGKPPKSDIITRTRNCRIGDKLVIKFVEPGKGDFIYRETLYRRGEGIMDLTFVVKDLKQEKARMADAGVDCIYSGRPKDSGAFALFDTRTKGGDVLIKLIEE